MGVYFLASYCVSWTVHNKLSIVAEMIIVNCQSGEFIDLGYVSLFHCCFQVLFNAVLESACSEQGARMSAMDSSSRNAGEMLDRLTLDL